MTPKLSIVAVLAGLLYAFAVAQVAYAVPPDVPGFSGAGTDVQAPTASPDAADRALAAKQALLGTTGRGLVFDSHRNTVGPDFWNYDANGQKIANSSPGISAQDLAGQLGDVGSVGVSTTSTSSSGREWPQVGVGLALGLVLMIGLFLAIRHTRVRQPAH